MTKIELPALPEPHDTDSGESDWLGNLICYTEEDLRDYASAYARTAILADRESLAKALDGLAERLGFPYGHVKNELTALAQRVREGV